MIKILKKYIILCHQQIYSIYENEKINYFTLCRIKYSNVFKFMFGRIQVGFFY